MTTIQQGTLTHLDMGRHHPFFFEVPEHTRQLTISFSYEPVVLAPALPSNEISLSLFGPDGARHNNRDLDIVLTVSYAPRAICRAHLSRGAGAWSSTPTASCRDRRSFTS